MAKFSSEIQMSGTAFWVCNRGRRFGPFDYQWSADLRGLELTYCGEKYGEVCSEDELFADLAPFRIPLAVCRVATIAAATIVEGIGRGESSQQRNRRLSTALERFGFDRFRIRDESQESSSS
ncbi:MAG: hypothetical protein R3C19_05725 [Planctomycetaceae bacterium]